MSDPKVFLPPVEGEKQEIDSLVCPCGTRSRYHIGIVATDKPCACGGHLRGRCGACGNRLCINCLEREVLETRKTRQVNLLSVDETVVS